MSSTIYLPRKLLTDDKIYTEAELLSASSYVVVLAEPGAGKTELMGSLAQQLGTTVTTANKFRYGPVKSNNAPLLIDAFDELAKVDASGIYELLGKASSVNPSHIYLSSRSSEWDNASTHAFKDFLGFAPLIVRLCEFDEMEQRAIFEHHARGEDFDAFQTEVARFDLEPLLPNPQFLKLFSDAYIESERRFTDKRSIFVLAVERLAREANNSVARKGLGFSVAKKVDLSSEVFAKLLLSGAEGVCTIEAAEERMYPALSSLFTCNTADDFLGTRLFKPGDSPDQHRPIHKIIAEYCAADYLTKRITDPRDSLNLSNLMTIIAPNSIVRDELRGLLGWMAALGNKPIEEAAITLDAYSVLANGDPSQLSDSSKRLLIQDLIEIESRDPYFRRGDFWRRFSVVGFFNQEVINEIKPLLTSSGEGQLRDLILELLTGSQAIKILKSELQQLTLSPQESSNTRLLASRCLLDITDHDHLADLNALIAESSHASMNIAAQIIETLGTKEFELAYLAKFFQVCKDLYPCQLKHSEITAGKRYFIKRLIAGLDLVAVEWLLDELTKDLACKCRKESYECSCRNGISKIVGSMLDRYFYLAKPPFDPLKVWQWVRNLNFYRKVTKRESKAVQVLQEDHTLRRGIIATAFGRLTDQDQIFEIRTRWFDSHAHSGLRLHSDDYKFLVDLAYENDNPRLWACFMARHQSYRDSAEQGPDPLRRHMREQACKKPLFLREWASANKVAKQFGKKHQIRNSRALRRRERSRRKHDDINAVNIKYVQENRKLIESGRHWGCLNRFAELLLDSPNNIKQEFGDETLVRNALKNCIDFIAPHVPDLPKLAELQCCSQYQQSERILYAACLEIMRVDATLQNVDVQLLKALRTNLYMHYRAVSKKERDALKIEVDRLIFPDLTSAEDFLRQYVEPQLAQSGCAHPEIWLLSHEETFSQLRATLSIEWLARFRDLALRELSLIFEIAARYGDRNELNKIIAERCAELIDKQLTSTAVEDIDQKRKFWFTRAFYFLNEEAEEYWDWLKADKDTVHLLYELSGRVRGNDNAYLPQLTSIKVEAILDAFIDKWPKVYLPSHWGTESSKQENAYRFLTEVIWSISADDPNHAIPVLERLLADQRFIDLQMPLKSIQAAQIRKNALRNFEPPTPVEIVNWLDLDTVATVEGLRQLVIQELQDFQRAIDGGEYNSADRFYEKGVRRNEPRSTEIIAERLHLRLESQGISVTPEHQLKSANRSDFTVSKIIRGKRRLLVSEVKGQWHEDLYTAASTQLHERYSIHPDAEHQGIFLVIWFGADEKVAGRKKHDIKSAKELKNSIELKLPQELKGLIDVFVLDVSKSQ